MLTPPGQQPIFTSIEGTDKVRTESKIF